MEFLNKTAGLEIEMCSRDHQTMMKLQLDCWGAPRSPKPYQLERDIVKGRDASCMVTPPRKRLFWMRRLFQASDRAAS